MLMRCEKPKVIVSQRDNVIKTVYIIGSLRNLEIPSIGNYLRELGFEVFDDWFAAGPIADDSWQDYETKRGRSYAEALHGYAAKHIFKFDLTHLHRADIALLVLPTGKSGHLEFGYFIGLGKPGYVLFDKTPDRWDQMYQFATAVYFDKLALGEALSDAYISRRSNAQSPLF